MTLWRSLRLGDALPLCLALASLSGCFPGENAGSTPSPSPSAMRTPVARATIPVHVGHVRIEDPAVASRPLKIAAVTSTPKPHPIARVSQAKASLAKASLAPVEPTPAYAFASPHAPPQILAINLSSLEVSSGETISGTIETTSNVASVEARISGWSMSVPRTRIGHFEASGEIPEIPFFLKGAYTLQVIARNADGVEVERDIPIALR